MPARQYLTQVGRAVADRPFYNLRKVTRTFEVNGGGLPEATINAEVLIAYGSADPEFPTALLVDRQMQQTSPAKSSYITGLTEVYQEFTAGEKVSVGEDQVIRLEDGREAVVKRFICLASEAEGLAAAVGDILGGKACQEAKISKKGVGAEIAETYISSGKLSESNSRKNNDKLLIKTLVYFNEVPPTPSGYYLTDDDVKNPEGVPTYTYQFAKGEGEISRKTSYRSSVDAGVNGITIVAIQHLTAPGVVVNPITTPAGTNLIDLDKNEQSGYMLWSAVYAKGIGRTRTRKQGRSDGSIAYNVTELGVSSATPAYPGTGTGVLVDLDNDQGEGFFINAATWIKLPADDEIPVPVEFPMPGYAFFSGTQLVLRPPTKRKLTATAEITYANSKLSTAMFSVERYGSFTENYTPTATGIPDASSRSLGSYLCDGNTVFGTDADYNGVRCDTYSATTFASTPSELPTGETVLDVQHDEYLTALDGTKYYRRTVLRATL